MAETTEIVVKDGEKSEVKKRPFWVSDEEREGVKQTPQDNLSDKVTAGVPELHDVEKGDIVGAWTKKDDLLIYHFYKRDRKQIYDQAHADMDADPDNQNAIALKANQDLGRHPWWPGFEQLLEEVFVEHFKHNPRKITYYQEADSFSVMMPEPSGPVPMSDTMLEAPFAAVALRVGG
mgnify:CR=1 FL=1